MTLFGRCHRLVRLMIAQLDLLETMSPKEYQEILIDGAAAGWRWQRDWKGLYCIIVLAKAPLRNTQVHCRRPTSFVVHNLLLLNVSACV